MTQDIRIALFPPGEMIAAIRLNDPETLKEWLCSGIKDMGRTEVEPMIAEWMNPLLNEEELDRIVAWHLGVSL